MGLGKPKQHTKFENASFSRCKNIKEKLQNFGEPLHDHAHFLSCCDFMMASGKPKLHTKFEVASLSCCRNIKGEPAKFYGAPLDQGHAHVSSAWDFMIGKTDFTVGFADPTNSFLLLEVYTSVANLVKKRQRNATVRVTTHGQTDANRFYYLSHAICYSYGDCT